MIVLNENQLNKLNILTAQNNNSAKEILKEADVKTILSQNKELNLSTVLKSLFKSVGNTKQSNETILNLLKKTNISKDMGSFSSNLQQLLKLLPETQTNKSLKTFLENFLVNIDKSSNTNIKEQLSKSGVFLESKLAKQLTNPNQKNESSILNDMKTLLLKTKEQLQSQSQTATISNKNMTISKESININETLKFIDKVLNQLNKSENIAPNEIKTLLNKIKVDIQNQITTNSKSEIVSKIDNLITKLSTNIDTNNQNSSKTEQTQQSTTISKENLTLFNEVKNSLTKVQSLIQNQLQQLQNNHIPKEIIQKVNETLNQIDKVLTQLNKSEEIPSKEIKTLLSNAKTQIENLTQIGSKVGIQTQTSQTQSSTSQLFELKAQLQTVSKEQLNPNEVIKQIDKLLTQINDLKSKPITTQQAVLQTNQTILKSDFPIFDEIKTLLNKIQTQLQNQLQNQFQNQSIDKIKTQIQSFKDSDQNEVSKQIDKLLNQIDYHQLYSLANTSNNVYVPFLWDLLEDGSIDLKKSDEDKFYCVIDLTLKDLGKVDIHLFMFKEEYLDISIFVEQDDTKQLIRKKLTSLKQALFNSDIKLQGINIYSKKSQTSQEKENIYEQNSNFDFGVNIKV